MANAPLSDGECVHCRLMWVATQKGSLDETIGYEPHNKVQTIRRFSLSIQLALGNYS